MSTQITMNSSLPVRHAYGAQNRHANHNGKDRSQFDVHQVQSIYPAKTNEAKFESENVKHVRNNPHFESITIQPKASNALQQYAQVSLVNEVAYDPSIMGIDIRV